MLLVVRLPSLVQPAGGDQGLYTYAAQRILAGDVMYRDVWDQKPPGIALIYAPLLTIWPGEAVVPGADLAAAAAVAILLVALGRRAGLTRRRLRGSGSLPAIRGSLSTTSERNLRPRPVRAVHSADGDGESGLACPPTAPDVRFI